MTNSEDPIGEPDDLEPDSEPPVDPEDLEPSEPDPGALGPEAPTAPDLSQRASEADPEVRTLFWWLVLVFNVALMAASVGLMFVAFKGNWTLGGQLILVGLVLGGYGYVRYRRFRRE